MQITDKMRADRASGMTWAQMAEKHDVGFDAIRKSFYRDNAVPKSNRPKSEKKSRGVKTLDNFRKQHDQSWKIRDGINRLFKDGVYMTDAEFREAVQGAPGRWRAAADSTEFSENRYRVHGELLWGSVETIREMRRIRGEVV